MVGGTANYPGSTHFSWTLEGPGWPKIRGRSLRRTVSMSVRALALDNGSPFYATNNSVSPHDFPEGACFDSHDV